MEWLKPSYLSAAEETVFIAFILSHTLSPQRLAELFSLLTWPVSDPKSHSPQIALQQWAFDCDGGDALGSKETIAYLSRADTAILGAIRRSLISAHGTAMSFLLPHGWSDRALTERRDAGSGCYTAVPVNIALEQVVENKTHNVC